jgi:hypothetical protein
MHYTNGTKSTLSLTPAKRLNKQIPRLRSGFHLRADARKAAQEQIPRLRSGFRLRASAPLTPAKRLNLTKLFAYFLHKKHVFLR